VKFKFETAPKPENVSQSDWMDWAWQLRQSFKTVDQFQNYFTLTDSELSAFQTQEVFNIRSTPYYASLAHKTLEHDPIRRILMPNKAELYDPFQAQLDPLGERKSTNNPTARVVHRYSDRALFLITDICSVYCRYCTRKHRIRKCS
jgi:lysine 2,3-aminomutase